MAPHAVRPASLAWPGARSRLSLRPPARKRKRKKKRQKEEHRRQNTEKTEEREGRRQKTEERTQRRKTTEDRRQQRFVFSQMSSSYWGCMRHDAFFWPRQAPTRRQFPEEKKRRARVFFSFLFAHREHRRRARAAALHDIRRRNHGRVELLPGRRRGRLPNLRENRFSFLRHSAFPRFVPSLSWQMFGGFSRIEWRATNNTVVFLPGPYTPAVGPWPRDRGCSRRRCRWPFSSRRAPPPPLG